MIELGISQAQMQFTKLLGQSVLIFDKKTHIKKAVMLPYEEYSALIKKAMSKEDLLNGGFGDFKGTLSNDFKVDDVRYVAIVK